jgi:predicted alpha/beta superfamily hydrolase
MRKTAILAFILLINPNLFAQNPAQPHKATHPFVLGIVDTIQSVELNEKRVLNIYLPEGYSPDSATAYPVIYLLDGSADEDFIHIAGLVQFTNFPWVNTLPKSILVGIANIDRRRDFTFPTTIEKDKKDFPTTGGSAKFISFIEKELQPYIENNYKTTSTKMLIGQSLGGLLATEILFKKPTLFSQYIIVSPSLWWDNESLLSIQPKIKARSFHQNTYVYVAAGKEGKIMENDAKKLVALLRAGNPKYLRVHFDYLNDKNHADIFHQAVYNAFLNLKEKQ